MNESFREFFCFPPGPALPSHQPDLLHQGHLVIEELLFNDLPVFPMGNRAELNLELLSGWLDHISIGTGHRPFECPGKVGHRAGPVPLAHKKHAPGAVSASSQFRIFFLFN
jgi:hypothetical protein